MLIATTVAHMFLKNVAIMRIIGIKGFFMKKEEKIKILTELN